MRRLFSATAVAVAAAAVFVGVAAAATASLTGGTATPGGTITISGTVTPITCAGKVCGQAVISVYTAPGCNQADWNNVALAPVSPSGAYSKTITNLPATTSGYSFEVYGPSEEENPFCLNVPLGATVPSSGGGATAPTPPNIFLCYSVDETQPGVWPKAEAEQLLKQGYWLPYAVPGEVPGGTNVGGYHLVCNIASTQSVSDSYVGEDGTVFGPDYAGSTIGLYPQVGS